MVQVYDKDLQTIVKVPQVNFNKTVAPTAAQDQTQGYHIGDMWIMTNNAAYLCTNDSAGAASWKTL